MSVKCFMVVPTSRFRVSLRRYRLSETGKCPSPKCSYHNADGPEIGIVQGTRDADGHFNLTRMQERDTVPRDDPRWPAKCDNCDYVFTAEDEWQLFHDHIYVDDAGKEFSLRQPVPGMMWDAFWAPDCWKGPDGLSLTVICPNGSQWNIDGPASNCTMKDDVGPFNQAHRCWVRHGTAPLISVDKNGRTCAAGAGSIQAGDYHGFLGVNGAPPGHFT